MEFCFFYKSEMNTIGEHDYDVLRLCKFVLVVNLLETDAVPYGHISFVNVRSRSLSVVCQI